MQRADIDPIAIAPLTPHLRDLARRGELRRYRKGTLLIQEGDFGQTLYIILEGQVRAFATGDKGREITYGEYGAGEYMGELSLDGGPRSASVETLKASLCAVITRQTLQQFIADVPEFAFELLAKVIRRARHATTNAKQMALLDVYGRLALLLEGLARPRPDGTRLIEPCPTQDDMRKRLGCSREMISKLLKGLKQGGWVRDDGNKTLVLMKALPPGW